SDKIHHPLVDLFDGAWDFAQPSDWQEWVQEWLHTEGKLASLNTAQEQGLHLPFRHALSLIQGPPGTGKTNLLGWILIALVRHAQARDEPLRIAVSALTHQAIDQVLSKVVKLVNQHDLPDFPGHCCKWGRWDGPDFDENSDEMQVEPLEAPEQVRRFSHLILGATGYGLTNLVEKNKTLPSKPFDWVIFDEASQVLMPQAMLSLVYGKGNFLFLGDVQQLPPVIRSAPLEQETSDFPDQQADDTHHTHDENLESEVRRSLLSCMLHRYPQQSVFLDLTYRMNAEICAFPVAPGIIPNYNRPRQMLLPACRSRAGSATIRWTGSLIRKNRWSWSVSIIAAAARNPSWRRKSWPAWPIAYKTSMVWTRNNWP
ncbi:MAG: hypothetical protein D3913_12225, partial [Candidatus Electrothrix sp. LOE1_4_5]|nr:hypothetical protein [Candidatus Electrothrix gigas]